MDHDTLNELYEILKLTTSPIFKEKHAVPEYYEQHVDVYFGWVGVWPELAADYEDDLLNILDKYPEQDRLRGGPSYIETGARIGSQGAALRLYALGQVLGIWSIVTPETLGFTRGPETDRLAGNGLVMIEGYTGA